MLFTPSVSEYLPNRPSSRPKISTTIELMRILFVRVLWTLQSKVWSWGDMEVAWCLFGSYDKCVGACDTGPGAGEGRKKDYREVKRARLNRDELKRSTTSSLPSPPASPLRILQWVGVMSTPTIILCLNNSILGTTSAYCQCWATLSRSNWVSTTIQFKSPNINFGAGSQVPPLLHLADNAILIQFRPFDFYLSCSLLEISVHQVGAG